MNRFFNSLRIECNVPIQILNPGVIKNTRFFDSVPLGIKPIVQPPKTALSPQKVADMILATYGKNIEVDVGVDAVLYRCLLWLAPPPLVDAIMKAVGKQFESGMKAKSE